MEDFLKSETQAISVADLLWLIYIFVYNICTCARLSDPPREVSFNLLKSRYAVFVTMHLALFHCISETQVSTKSAMTAAHVECSC